MSTDPKNWRPGDIVTVGQPGATGEVELWDRAPVTMATRGYCDPWWARHEGRWVLVERQRKSRHSVGYIRATDVHDRVLSGLATMNRLPAAGSRGRHGALDTRAALARLSA